MSLIQFDINRDFAYPRVIIRIHINKEQFFVFLLGDQRVLKVDLSSNWVYRYIALIARGLLVSIKFIFSINSSSSPRIGVMSQLNKVSRPNILMAFTIKYVAVDIWAGVTIVVILKPR